MSRVRKILVLGSVPPPIGGVTIHVKRLCEQLNNRVIAWDFIDYKKSKIANTFLKIIQSKTIHLHSSNPYVRLMLSLFCFITTKKIFITYHGNLGRYGRIRNLADRLSIALSTIPIVINKNSYNIANKINKNSRLISAFIPPANISPLSDIFLAKIQYLKDKFNILFCTNAYNVSYDKNGIEIYQITELVRLFNRLPKMGLIVSDPSGNYAKLLENSGAIFNPNILFLSVQHDFNAVIREADCLIRFTTTDGDSLSVKEALIVGKPVIATDIVDRPQQVILVKDDIADLEYAIKSFNPNTDTNIRFSENGFNDMYRIYCDYLK